MPLARIITRSQECSRQLAIDLLARGYTVQIVSPEQIPNDIADLEVRVDTAPGEQLIANIDARDGAGNRSASLDFVHHLKAPMSDLVRRTPPPADSLPRFIGPIPEVNIGDRKVPAEIPPTAREGLPRKPWPVLKVIDLPMAPPPQAPGCSPAENPAVAKQPKFAPAPAAPMVAVSQTQNRSARSAWGAALMLACIALLALVFAFGVRPSAMSRDISGDRISGSPAKDKLPAALDSGNNPAKSPGPAATAAPASAPKPEANSALQPTASPIALPPKASASEALPLPAKSGASAQHDSIAQDTVIYFDKHAAETAPSGKPEARSVAGRRNPRTVRSGVIAANTVTYFNTKPAAKPAKPDSADKPAPTINPN